jgi:CRP-like cAMP-binding protein
VQLLASARDAAAQIVQEAHRQAAAHVQRLDEAAVLEREAWFAEQARLFDVRASDVLAAVPGTVMAIVHAVLDAAAEAQPDLAIRASVDIAVRVLQTEMRRQVLCHPLDLQATRGLAARLEAASIEPHASIDRGDLAFVMPQGEVRVSGPRAMQALAEDLRKVLSSARS